MATTLLTLQNLTKRFDAVTALDNVSLTIGQGEFITLLGPSGCGKTTTLRIISGLETPDEGRVLLGGQDVTDWEPNKRNVNTVFQNYALFPHMNVFANVAYGLKIRRTPKDEIAKKVADALSLVQLSGYEKRTPAQLSGGQKQRVAIARALVNEPSLLLLDEPLGALDLQLRRQMQLELKRLQKQLGITFIYITHDQEEALNMSDRIAVMDSGRIIQLGTPAQVYDAPDTAFVAKFIGTANIIPGTVVSFTGDTAKIETGSGFVFANKRGDLLQEGKPCLLAVRAEALELTPGWGEVGLLGSVHEKSFAGGMLRISIRLKDGQEIVASRHGIDSDLKSGDPVSVTWKVDSAIAVREDAK